MVKIIAYEIVAKSTIQELEDFMGELLSKTDYQPLGGHVETYSMVDETFSYTQTIVIYETGEE